MNRKMRRIMSRLHKKDGDDGQGGGGGGGIDFNSESFKSAVNSAVEEATAGLKTKNDELLGKLNTTTEQLKSFEGLNPEAIKKMIEQAGQSEEAKLIADGKIDEVIAKRIDKQQAQWDEKYNELNTNFEQANKAADHYKNQYERKIVDDGIRAEAIKSKVLPEALDDVLRRAGEVFTITKDGEIEARDGQGNLVKTEDGQLLTPERFVEGLKKQNPYYWPSSGGTGSRGSNENFQGSDAMDKINNMAKGGNFNLDEYRAMRKKMSGDDYHSKRY